jgi:methyl-accepting chemotaxis protein
MAQKIGSAIGTIDKSAASLRAGMDTVLEPLREMGEFQRVIIDMKQASSGVEGHMRSINNSVEGLAEHARRAREYAEKAGKQIENATRKFEDRERG